MSEKVGVLEFRVRYSEVDHMGAFYSSRALEWFERGRTELLRQTGISYADMESRGVFLPVIEAHIRYLSRARYDDLLRMTTRARTVGRVRVRFDVDLAQADSGAVVARGYTIHAVTNSAGRPIRPPGWFDRVLAELTGNGGTNATKPPRGD